MFRLAAQPAHKWGNCSTRKSIKYPACKWRHRFNLSAGRCCGWKSPCEQVRVAYEGTRGCTCHARGCHGVTVPVPYNYLLKLVLLWRCLCGVCAWRCMYSPLLLVVTHHYSSLLVVPRRRLSGRFPMAHDHGQGGGRGRWRDENHHHQQQRDGFSYFCGGRGRGRNPPPRTVSFAQERTRRRTRADVWGTYLWYMLVVLVVYLPVSDHTMKRQARITLTVACIRTCLFLFFFDVWIQGRVWSNTNVVFRFYWLYSSTILNDYTHLVQQIFCLTNIFR